MQSSRKSSAVAKKKALCYTVLKIIAMERMRHMVEALYPFTAQSFVLFADSDEPQRFLTGSECFRQGKLVAKKKTLCYTVLKIIAKVGIS